MPEPRDHGGGLDGAVAQYGGTRADWLDLSTGINPVPYPVGTITADAWHALPDTVAQARLIRAARTFWQIPDAAEVIAAPGASALIARIPTLCAKRRAYIPGPTYNEHRAAFEAAGVSVHETPVAGATRVFVHPNNPDGADRRRTIAESHAALTVIDESFCDISPEWSVTPDLQGGQIVLKSFGKFWGLAGLRLGFAIGMPGVLTSQGASMRDLIGPWAVAGPALEIGARALEDQDWASQTRLRLVRDAARLDALLGAAGAQLVGGTGLFRLYDVGDAAALQSQLARGRVWSRIFPYSSRWLRLGLPAPDRWEQLEAALT